MPVTQVKHSELHWELYLHIWLIAPVKFLTFSEHFDVYICNHIPSRAVTPFVEWQEEHQNCKNLAVAIPKSSSLGDLCGTWTYLKWSPAKQETQLMTKNPCGGFIGQSRSPNIVPFHMLGIVSSCAIVTLSSRYVRYSTSKNVVTLKSGSEITQGHWNWYHSIDCIWFPISVL